MGDQTILDATPTTEPESLVRVEGPLAFAIARPPEIVLEEAHRAAKALKQVIDAKPKKVMMGDEVYLEFEDWQTVGRFYGISPRTVSTAYVTYGAASGWEARADAVHVATQHVVSSAEAMCLNDEDKWSARAKYEWHYEKKSGGTSKDDPGPAELIWERSPDGKNRPKKVRLQVQDEAVPLFQLRSMAQTRAMAKAMRNALAWVVVLAGYKPTPAEELPETKVIETIATPMASPPSVIAADDVNAQDKAEIIESIETMRGQLHQTPGKRKVEQARLLGPNVELADAPIDKLVALAAHLAGQLRQGVA